MESGGKYVCPIWNCWSCSPPRHRSPYRIQPLKLLRHGYTSANQRKRQTAMNLMYNQLNQGNPRMVILARESRGLGQQALAEALHVSQGTISKIETDLIPLTDEMMESLSEVLDYPPHFFRQEGDITGIGIAEIFHRKRQNVPQRVLNKIYALIEIRIKHVSALLVSTEVTSNIPRMDVEEYNDHVEDIARAVRAQLQL